MQLPAKVRQEFNHDPHAFVIFCSDEKNLPQLAKWGLTGGEYNDRVAKAEAEAEAQRAADAALLKELRDGKRKESGGV